MYSEHDDKGLINLMMLTRYEASMLHQGLNALQRNDNLNNQDKATIFLMLRALKKELR